MIDSPQIASLKSKLDRLSRSEGRTSMEMLTLFLLERAVARLMLDDVLQKELVFKGGYVSLRVYGSRRFTTDIDAVVHGIPSEEATRRIETAMRHDMKDGTWFYREKQTPTLTQGPYGGISIKYRSGLGEMPKKVDRALQIGIDLGIGDPVTPGAVKTKTAFSIGEGEISWKVYPVETIIAEKLHAFFFLGNKNSRAKDIYDMNMFWDQADHAQLRRAIEETFKYRTFAVPRSLAEAAARIDTKVLRRGWDSATSSITPKVKFDDVYQFFLRKLTEL